MLLADTSVWVDHFRKNDPDLTRALVDDDVLMHPFVLGEIACGNLSRRSLVLSDLKRLPAAILAEHAEVLTLLEQHRLFGKGIGWIDAHLLASAALTRCMLWTRDIQLARVASELRLLGHGSGEQNGG